MTPCTRGQLVFSDQNSGWSAWLLMLGPGRVKLMSPGLYTKECESQMVAAERMGEAGRLMVCVLQSPSLKF